MGFLRRHDAAAPDHPSLVHPGPFSLALTLALLLPAANVSPTDAAARSFAQACGRTLALGTLEDIYDSDAGSKIQAAFGFLVFEGSNANPSRKSYGAAIDDVVIEWSESHPVEQAPDAGCGGGVCAGGARPGRLCFNADDCGKACVGGTSAGADCTLDPAICLGGGGACTAGSCPGGSMTSAGSCAALSWEASTLFAGSGTVTLALVDFNAATTQGGFDCARYGYTSGCGGGSCASSNDCDADGLNEVEVDVQGASEASSEKVRLEQTSAGGPGYAGAVAFSSALDYAVDGIVFLQYNGVSSPVATARYFDRDSGSADGNADGIPDSPPGNGLDRCPGFCAVDDDRDALGPDHRPGDALRDDDSNGICDFRSPQAGKPCVSSAACPGGECLNVDEPDELCGRTCTTGSASGLCSAASGNAGAVCTAPGAPGTCTGGGTCVAINCVADADCGAGGSCPGSCANGSSAGGACHQLSDCTGGAVGGACVRASAWGDDLCASIDEPDEQCALVAGRLASGIDDNCGCAANPVSASLEAFFETADLIVQSWGFTDSGDQDGFADDHELVGVALVLRNVGPHDIEDVKVRLSSRSPGIACFHDPTAAYGRINALDSASNGADTLSFAVGSVGRTSLAETKEATITVTVTGTAVFEDGSRAAVQGTSTPQSFTFDLDLDASGAVPVGKTTKVFGFEASSACVGGVNHTGACTIDADCPGGGSCAKAYASGAAWDSDWFHTFVADHDGLHCQYNDPSGLLARSAPRGCFLRQDFGTQVPDDWHLHAAVTGGIQSDGGRDSGTPGTCVNGMFPGSACSQSQDCVGDCTGAQAGNGCASSADCIGACTQDPLIQCTTNARCRFCTNDHSRTCTSSSQCVPGGSCSTGTCQGVGTCTNPPPGTCTGTGNASMHMGVHFSGDVSADSVHLDNIFYAYYRGDDLGGGVRSPLQIGLGRPGIDDATVVSWWQQVCVLDERTIGGLGEPYALDAGVVHVLVDRNGDGTPSAGSPGNPLNDGFWEKVQPYYGAPRQQRFPTGNCMYDPDDDGDNEDDLDGGVTPQNGRATGPSSTCFPEFVWACVGDTQDPPYSPGLGQSEPNAICFPEVDGNDRPIVRQGNGPGRWVEARVDLSRYKGRKIWFRFLTSHIQFGGCTWSGPLGGCSVFGGPYGGNRDDGWYIDELRFAGTSAPFALVPDADPPPTPSCPSVTCGTPEPLTARFTGSTYATRHDGIDNDGNGATDEQDEGASTAVASDAPLRGVGLNGQDFAPSTGTCLDGVLEYRYWADRDLDGSIGAGELIRDFAEDPRASANPLCDERLVMDLRCSSAPFACASRATLDVTVAGRLGPLASVVLPGAVTMTWAAQAQAVAYDVAYRRIAAGHFDGDFSGFADPGGGPCATGCGIGAATYAVGCKGSPPLLNLDLWIVRARGGSWVATWDEGGRQLGSRDTGPTGVPPSVCP